MGFIKKKGGGHLKTLYKIVIYFTYILNKFKSHVYKKKFLQCGNNLKIFGKINVHNPYLISLGNNVNINSNVSLLARGKIKIGNNVTLSLDSKVITTGYDTSNWENDALNKRVHKNNDVFINDGAWVGAGAIILPGVNIKGKGVIVGAGAVVTKDINEDFVLVAGNPARVIKRINRS